MRALIVIAAVAVGIILLTALSSSVSTVPLQETSLPPPSAVPVVGIPVDASEDFEGSARPLNHQERKWMNGETWHPGCPVPMGKLRLLEVSYHDFTGVTQPGRVVVHKDVAEPMLGVFETLYEAGYPFDHLDTTELYPPGLRPNKLRNVTAAFNCRPIAGTSTWSQHSYGKAIDINPEQNPWVDDGRTVPSAGAAYTDRTQLFPAMIHSGDEVDTAFKSIGWGWGGDWTTKKDYMHFSETGG